MHRDALTLRCGVRTTADLPEELHKQAQAIVRDTWRTSSETVAEHVRHDAAAEWLSTADTNFATCPITQGSLLRFLLRAGQSASAARDVVHGDVAVLVPA